MIYGTHNSLSSYKVKNWWFKPLNFTSKCQSKTIKEQLDAGCRYFDIRLRLHKGKLYAAHGLMIYDITFQEFLNEVNSYNTTDTIYYRILVEDAIGYNGVLYEEVVRQIAICVLDNFKDNVVWTRVMSKAGRGQTHENMDVSVDHFYYTGSIKRLLGLPYPALTADILNQVYLNIPIINQPILMKDFL